MATIKTTVASNSEVLVALSSKLMSQLTNHWDQRKRQK